MYHIAVCDDEPLFCAHIVQIIRQLAGKNLWSFDIDVFYDGISLVQKYQEHHSYDIIFLDMYLKTVSGYETAVKIREFDQNAIIIVLSGAVDYMREVFKINAFRYILKSKLKCEIEEAITQAIKKIQLKKHELFFIREGDEITRLYLRDIFYFEYSNRYVVAHTTTGNYSFSSRISDIEIHLSDRGFVRCYKSIIVNADYIWKVKDYEIYLTSGHKLPVSRKYLKNTMDAVVTSVED